MRDRQNHPLRGGSQSPALDRRKFVGGMAATSVVIAATGARAQQALPVVALASGHLPVEVMAAGRECNPRRETCPHPSWVAFFAEMSAQGFVEGENVTYSVASGIENMSSLRLQGRRLEAIGGGMAGSGAVAVFTDSYWIGIGAGLAEEDVPVVFTVSDAVATGLVASLEQPGGKVTGVNVGGGADTEGARLDLLARAVPSANTIAYLIRDQVSSPTKMGERLIDAAQGTASRLNKNLVMAPIDELRNEAVMDSTQWQRAFFDLVSGGPDALLVAQIHDPLVAPRAFGQYAFAARLPAIAPWREFAESGGLMSYGAKPTAVFTQGAQQLAAVLKGASPADLPVQQPAEMELVVNLNTARHIGITIPDALVAEATEVIG